MKISYHIFLFHRLLLKGLSATLSFSLCLTSFFFFNLLISLCPLNPGGHYSLFRPFFYHSHVLSTSIHPADCLTGRVCCFYSTDIGSLPRACPRTSDGSPGPCPRIAWWNYGPSRAHSATRWANTHTIPNTEFTYCARRRQQQDT